MEGTVAPAATAALLTALRVKGEAVPEIVGFARAMRRFAASVEAPPDVVDTCGTGGDAKGTINVSTAAAFVARGAGVVIAKHGNRAATSRAGSADVLEALGAEIELSPQVSLVHRGGRHRVHILPHPPPCYAVRGPGAASCPRTTSPARAPARTPPVERQPSGLRGCFVGPCPALAGLGPSGASSCTGGTGWTRSRRRGDGGLRGLHVPE